MVSLPQIIGFIGGCLLVIVGESLLVLLEYIRTKKELKQNEEKKENNK